MTPPYFPTWPSGAAITLGYALISIRMYLQLLNIADPGRFPAYAPVGGDLHVVEEGKAALEPVPLGILSLAALTLLLFSGVRIAFATALCGFLGLWMLRGYDPAAALAATSIIGHLTNYNLLVLPLFILMGFFGYYAGITRDLSWAARQWFGKLPGVLAIATILGSA